MLLNLKGFYKGKKFNLAIDHQSLKMLLLSHMLSKSNLPQLIRKLTQGASAYQIAGFASKLIKSCATKPKRVCEFFLKISSSQHYLTQIYFFKIPQTSNTLSFFPPSIKIHHPSPRFPQEKTT